MTSHSRAPTPLQTESCPTCGGDVDITAEVRPMNVGGHST
jgi:hypothetical protein